MLRLMHSWTCPGIGPGDATRGYFSCHARRRSGVQKEGPARAARGIVRRRRGKPVQLWFMDEAASGGKDVPAMSGTRGAFGRARRSTGASPRPAFSVPCARFVTTVSPWCYPKSRPRQLARRQVPRPPDRRQLHPSAGLFAEVNPDERIWQHMRENWFSPAPGRATRASSVPAPEPGTSSPRTAASSRYSPTTYIFRRSELHEAGIMRWSKAAF